MFYICGDYIKNNSFLPRKGREKIPIFQNTKGLVRKPVVMSSITSLKKKIISFLKTPK